MNSLVGGVQSREIIRRVSGHNLFSEFKTYGFLATLILAMSALAVGGTGVAYFFAGTISNVTQFDAIIMMGAGGGCGMILLMIIMASKKNQISCRSPLTASNVITTTSMAFEEKEKRIKIFEQYGFTRQDYENMDIYIDSHQEKWRTDLVLGAVTKIDKKESKLARSLHVFHNEVGELQIFVLLKTKGGVQCIGRGMLKTVKLAICWKTGKLYANSTAHAQSLSSFEKEQAIMKSVHSKSIAAPFLYLLKRTDKPKLSAMQPYYNGGSLEKLPIPFQAESLSFLRRQSSQSYHSSDIVRRGACTKILSCLRLSNAQATQDLEKYLEDLSGLDKFNSTRAEIFVRSHEIIKKINELLIGNGIDQEIHSEINLLLLIITQEFLSREEKRTIFGGILAGMSCLQSHGILHCDFHAGNIFLEKDESGKVIGLKIADFDRAERISNFSGDKELQLCLESEFKKIIRLLYGLLERKEGGRHDYCFEEDRRLKDMNYEKFEKDKTMENLFYLLVEKRISMKDALRLLPECV